MAREDITEEDVREFVRASPPFWLRPVLFDVAPGVLAALDRLRGERDCLQARSRFGTRGRQIEKRALGKIEAAIAALEGE